MSEPRAIGGYEIIGPVAYQGKADCMDVRCTRRFYPDEPHIRPGCIGYHCVYCDEPCSSQGHQCPASDAILGEASRIAQESADACPSVPEPKGEQAVNPAFAPMRRLHEGVDGLLHTWWCMAVPWVGVAVGDCDCARARPSVSPAAEEPGRG